MSIDLSPALVLYAFTAEDGTEIRVEEGERTGEPGRVYPSGGIAAPPKYAYVTRNGVREKVKRVSFSERLRELPPFLGGPADEITPHRKLVIEHLDDHTEEIPLSGVSKISEP